MRSKANFFAILCLIVLGIILYTLTIRGVAGNPNESTIKQTLSARSQPFELSPERGRFAHVLALAEDHTYALDKTLADFAYPDVGYYNGKFFSFFAPGISYMAVPFYLLGKHFNLSQVFTFGFISLFGIFNLILVFKISRDILKMPVWASMFASLTFGFGSTSWSYATTLYQHHLTTFFMLASFYAIYRYKNGGNWLWAFSVWVWYGLGISIDYPNAILLLPVMFYLLIVSFKVDINQVAKKVKVSFRMASALTMVGFVVIMGLHLYHNQYYLGSWKQLSGGLPSYTTNFSDNSSNQAILNSQKDKNVVAFFHEDALVQGIHILTISRDRGIFFYGPIFLLGVLGLLYLTRKINLEYSVLIALVIVNFGLYSSWGDPWGGWAYGSRYLIPSMSILAMFAAYFVQRPGWNISKKLLAIVLFAYSSAVALLGALTTNAVPPKSEADLLHAPYSYDFNIALFKLNESGSYIYNTFISKHLNLLHYGLFIYLPLMLIVVIVLFFIPIYER